MSADSPLLKRTPFAELEAMTPHDLVVYVQNLEAQRLMWTRRVALYERRSLGLEELLTSMVHILQTMFTEQKKELIRLAGIATNCADFARKKVDELEALCDTLEDDEEESGDG